MTKPAFGQPVAARDIEHLVGGPQEFTRLCGAVIASALGEAIGSYTVPRITELIHHPDRGADAEFTTPVLTNVPERGGLVGPGRTVYQFKWRNVSLQNKSRIVDNLVRQLHQELANMRDRLGSLPDRYVLLTNIDLPATQYRKLAEGLRKGIPEFEERLLVIWGAAELALALNNWPHLRHTFFSEGVLCTLEVIEAELQAEYRDLGWADLVGREAETAMLQRFAEGPERVLQVFGPPYVGKTRTVLEALRPEAGRVAWASYPEALTEDHFRDLDSVGRTILVVDHCEGEILNRIAGWALARSRLKTIIIGKETFKYPGVLSLQIEPLADDQARQLLHAFAPRTSGPLKSWLLRLAGGIPGLLVYLVGLAEAQDHLQAATVPANVFQFLGDLLERRFLTGLSETEQRALRAFSVLPHIGAKGQVSEEIRKVCRALQYNPREVLDGLPSLEKKGLVRERGRFYEVVPSFLGEHLAAKVLARESQAVPRLILELEEPARLRLLERLRNLAWADEIRDQIEEVFSPQGWFPNLDELVRKARGFRALVPANPEAALRCLTRTLVNKDATILKEKVQEEARREIIWALQDLVLGRDTFEGAATLLLALAEAETERFANNATGVFINLFHYAHPEMPVPLGERLAFLQKAAQSESAEQRRIVARATGEALRSHAIFFAHHPEGPKPPEPPARPKTWDEVRRYAQGILDILQTLSNDPAEHVRDEATSQILTNFRQFIRLSIGPADVEKLGLEAFKALGTLARRTSKARVHSKIVSELELLLSELDKVEREWQEKGWETGGLQAARHRTQTLLNRLTEGSFDARLKRWAGPLSWGVKARDRAQGELEKLAQEILKRPRLLTKKRLDWLVSEEAENAGWLFQKLGQGDKKQRWLQPLLDRMNAHFGYEAFSRYIKGWAERDREGAEQFLDRLLEPGQLLARLIEAKPDAAEGIFAATWRLPASRRAVERILKLTQLRLLSREVVARQLTWGGWTRDLTPEEFALLVEGLDDRNPKTAFAILDLLAQWIHGKGPLPEPIRERAWSLLENAATQPEPGDSDIHHWDEVAAHLGQASPERLLNLIEHLVAGKRIVEGTWVIDRLRHGGRIWQVLERHDRPGLISMLMRLALGSSEMAFWVRWSLRELIDPVKDHERLLRFAREHGEKGAVTVAEVLDGSRNGFWELMRDLLIEWGDQEEVCSQLLTCLVEGAWRGSRVPLLKERLKKAQGLAEDQDPRVSRWARRAISMLTEEIQREGQRDVERFIWDYDIRRPELVEILKRKDSPERLWAIGRILRYAPQKEVLELLTLDDIREVLPHVDLPNRQRKLWEAYLAHWSRDS